MKRILSNKRLLLFIAIGVVLLAGIGAALWFFVFSKQAAPEEPISPVRQIVATDQEVERAREIVGITGKLISVNVNTKQLVLADEAGVETTYAVNDKTTVHQGVAAIEKKLEDIPMGQNVGLTYDSKANVIMDVWYEDAS